MIIVALPIDSWRLFNPLSPCWAQIYFLLFCLAQLREVPLPLALTLISQNRSVYSQQRCQVTGSWSSQLERWGRFVKLCDSWAQILLLNIQTIWAVYYSIAIHCGGVFSESRELWQLKSLSLKAFLVLLFLPQWMKEESNRSLITALTQGSRKMANGWAPTSGEFVLQQLKWRCSDLCGGELSGSTSSPSKFSIITCSTFC